MWNRNQVDENLKTGRGILESAFYTYKSMMMSYRFPSVFYKKYVNDKTIHVGINTGNYVLAATPVIFGNIVSVNKKVWKCRKPIILYVGEAHAFYLIKQKEVKDAKEISFPNCTLINFDIHAGVNLTKIFPEYTEEEKEKKLMGF
ncbi:MAG: hypothetical protein NT155_03590 [Candidatus Staskawiczbacteria bacterium]|nr:hypothetical protein [Candidatus Staskawiczbacteria bacterium]